MRSLAILVVSLVAVSACSGTAAETSTSAVATTPAPPSTTVTPTTAAQSTTTAAATTTTTTSAAPSDQVGDPGLLQEAVDAAIADARRAYDDDTLTVDTPDLTNPDPLVALQEMTDFSQTVNAQFPLRTWASVITYPGSPEEDVTVQNADENLFNNWIRITPEEPLVYTSMQVVDIATIDVPEEAAEGLPADSVGVLTTSSIGPLVLADRDSGEVAIVITEGWTERPALSILVPTDAGWREWDTILDFGVEA